MTDHDKPLETMWEGKFVKAMRRGRWEFAARTRGIEAAVILAIDADKNGDDHVILVEQYRVPLQRRCLELPAGLVGDDREGEAVATAAARELEEETGYHAERIVPLGHFHASPGMDEQQLFAKFERWHADQQRQKASAGRSSFADTPDWE